MPPAAGEDPLAEGPLAAQRDRFVGRRPASDERETWEMFGIVFEGHPDLRRCSPPRTSKASPAQRLPADRAPSGRHPHRPAGQDLDEHPGHAAGRERPGHAAGRERRARAAHPTLDELKARKAAGRQRFGADGASS